MSRWPSVLLLGGLARALGGCKTAEPKVEPQYSLGRPYQLDGVWRYPREDFTLNETGLATIYERRGATVSGEAFDGSALAGAHPTLQLPALARVTNLENGRQILVRVNDRGPDNAGRSLGLTRRAAELLGAAGTTALRVRMEVMEAESRRMASDARPETPALAVKTAPSGAVQAESLAPPPGSAQAGRVQQAAAGPIIQAGPKLSGADAVPLRLPEAVTQVQPRPGKLAIECGGFSQPDHANTQRERLARLGAYITTDYYAPRDRAFIVRLGPYGDVAAAEAAMRRALPLVPDARIVVE